MTLKANRDLQREGHTGNCRVPIGGSECSCPPPPMVNPVPYVFPPVFNSPEEFAQTQPARACACVGVVTDWIVTHLPIDMMVKHYGRVVTPESGVAWVRCPHCGGSGVDRRP